MKLNLKNGRMFGPELEAGIASATNVSRERFAKVSNAARGLIGNDDLTHAWDGWLFAILAACAAWPILQALGLFN